MDIRKIKTLIEMLEESNLKEIEVSQGNESVRISKADNKISDLEINEVSKKNISENS
jgi:acetyl-CoA carboxylase biotin carboxyl carrier protein|tara:strand:- start:33 stop:203 length:171 start_codon:yes stop_codon:yes gene_type:complete